MSWYLQFCLQADVFENVRFVTFLLENIILGLQRKSGLIHSDFSEMASPFP